MIWNSVFTGEKETNGPKTDKNVVDGAQLQQKKKTNTLSCQAIVTVCMLYTPLHEVNFWFINLDVFSHVIYS